MRSQKMHVVSRCFELCCVLAVIVGGVQVSVDPAGVLILAPRLLCSVIASGKEAHPLPCEPAHSSASATWPSTPQRGLPLRALRSGHGRATPSAALLSWQGCTVADGDVAEDAEDEADEQHGVAMAAADATWGGGVFCTADW